MRSSLELTSCSSNRSSPTPRQQPQEIAIIDDRGQYTYQQLAAMAAGLGMYLVDPDASSRASACCCRPARVRRQFLRNAAGGQERRADQLPAGRPRDRPHHRRQRHRHGRHDPAARGPAEGHAAERRSTSRSSRKTPPAAITPQSFPQPDRRRPGRADVHQRHERPAQGRACSPTATSRATSTPRSSTRSCKQPAQVPRRHPAVPRVRHDRDDARADPARARRSIYIARFSPVGGAERDPRAQGLADVRRAEHVRRDRAPEGRHAGGFQDRSTP